MKLLDFLNQSKAFKVNISDFVNMDKDPDKEVFLYLQKDTEKWIRRFYNTDRLSYEYDYDKNILKVSSKGNVYVKYDDITALNNENFIWDTIEGDFDCSNCYRLSSLLGAPKKVTGNFYCYLCSSLTSLEGAPEIVEGNFDCYKCMRLKSLKGAPKKIGGHFNCYGCGLLKSLKGLNHVGGKIINLKSQEDNIDKDI